MDIRGRADRTLTRPVLELRGITKRFGRTTALDGAELRVERGTVHALLGENGAGKTTLMRVAFGMIRPDSGAIVVDNVTKKFDSPAQAIGAGLGMVQQHFALVDAMTVAENVALVSDNWLYTAATAATRTHQLAEQTGLVVDPAARAGDLSVEAQQRVEIVKALARDARILILDEPTAVLAPVAAADLLQWLRRFADDGRTVVLITHKLRDALAVADDVTVLRRGRTVLSTPARDATEASLTLAMLGTGAPAAPMRATTGVRGPVVVRAEHVRIVDQRGVVKIVDATFEARSGEILGVAAVEGEGQIELLRALAGRSSVAAGRITAPGDIGFVPEDRQRDALIADFPLFENVYLRGAGRRTGRVRWSDVKHAAAALIAGYDVRAEGPETPANALSGGNQQKLVVAREIEGGASALVVENPTRGLDVQAAAAIRDRLRGAREHGTAVIVYSSDLDEVLDLADRIIVVAQGKVTEIMPPLDRDTVGRAMLGLSE